MGPNVKDSLSSVVRYINTGLVPQVRVLPLDVNLGS